MLSDSDSSDSDNGIRFKTTSTRSVVPAGADDVTLSASINTNSANGVGRGRSGSRDRHRANSRDRHRDDNRHGRRSSRDRGEQRKPERRSESRDRRRIRSSSRDRQTQTSTRVVNKANTERRRSRSRDRQRDRERERTPRDRDRDRERTPRDREDRKRIVDDRKHHVAKPMTKPAPPHEPSPPPPLSPPTPTKRLPPPRQATPPKRPLPIEKSSTDVINLIDDKSNKILNKKSKHKKHKRTRHDDDSKESTPNPTPARIVNRPRSIDRDSMTSNRSHSDNLANKLPSRPHDRSIELENHHHRRPYDRRSHDRGGGDDTSSICGPTLPPHLRGPTDSRRSRSNDRAHEKPRSSSSAASKSNPSTSSSSNRRRYDDVSSHNRSTSASASGTRTSSSSKRGLVGPAAPPPEFLEKQHNQYKQQLPPPTTTDDIIMSDISETEDDYLIGPVPIGVQTKSEAHLELERRALELKLAKYDDSSRHKPKDKERETWMTELPDVKPVAGLGLAARQFRTKDRPDLSDRSSWTDTPREKSQKSSSHNRRPLTTEEIKVAKRKEADALYMARRDAEQEAAARKHKKKYKRDESLMDIHQKKMKRKKEKEESSASSSSRSRLPDRRPFNRENDLKVNRFDHAQKAAMMKKAQLLDNRFGSGESKYL